MTFPETERKSRRPMFSEWSDKDSGILPFGDFFSTMNDSSQYADPRQTTEIGTRLDLKSANNLLRLLCCP